jgi:hypothetical protein
MGLREGLAFAARALTSLSESLSLSELEVPLSDSLVSLSEVHLDLFLDLVFLFRFLSLRLSLFRL